MINLEKVGEFLKTLRLSKHLSQQQLANDLYVTRQAISLWELGRCFPDIDTVANIAKYFGVSIADIYAGQVVKTNEEYNSIISFLIKSEMKKTRKVLAFSVIIISTLLLLFLTYYFFNVYSKITVYTINTLNEGYEINGVITKSVNDVYINFELDEPVNELCLTYNEDNIICTNDTNYIIIKEQLGYNESIPALSNISIKDFIDNLYVNIKDNNNEYRIKLNITQDYTNNNLFFNKEEIALVDTNYELNDDVPQKVKDNFEYDEKKNIYYYMPTKNTIINYIVNVNSFTVQELSKSKIKTYTYNVKSKTLNYSVLNVKNNKTEEDISNYNENEKNKIYTYFENNYLNKYIY